MPVYNFQARFAPKVLDGTKCTTIRGRDAKVGSTAYLFTGLRTKLCTRPGQGEIVHCAPISLGYKQNGMPAAILGCNQLTQQQLTELAVGDGFTGAREMLEWFEKTYGERIAAGDGGHYVYKGWLITWGTAK